MIDASFDQDTLKMNLLGNSSKSVPIERVDAFKMSECKYMSKVRLTIKVSQRCLGMIKRGRNADDYAMVTYTSKGVKCSIIFSFDVIVQVEDGCVIDLNGTIISKSGIL